MKQRRHGVPKTEHRSYYIKQTICLSIIEISCIQRAIPDFQQTLHRRTVQKVHTLQIQSLFANIILTKNSCQTQNLFQAFYRVKKFTHESIFVKNRQVW